MVIILYGFIKQKTQTFSSSLCFKSHQTEYLLTADLTKRAFWRWYVVDICFDYFLTLIWLMWSTINRLINNKKKIIRWGLTLDFCSCMHTHNNQSQLRRCSGSGNSYLFVFMNAENSESMQQHKHTVALQPSCKQSSRGGITSSPQPCSLKEDRVRGGANLDD